MLKKNNLNNCKSIAVTCGEPSSIATEVLFKSWLELKNSNNLSFFTINNIDYLESIKKLFNYKDVFFEKITSPEEASRIFSNKIPVIDIPLIRDNLANTCETVVLSKPNTNFVQFVLESINKSIEYAIANQVKAIVTMPIEKYIMQKGGFNFIGHTEYLAYKSNSRKPVMLMASPFSKLKVVPIKTHISLKQSAELLNEEEIIETILIINKDLQKYLNKSINIAVLGLNPHAGERGIMGTEEISTIIPAINKLQKKGIKVTGPLPSDTAFSKANITNFDVIVGMYHDQVLTPFKTLLFEEGVNVTLGLPFIRTSPDHGTAFDIATKNIANPKSAIAALLLANNLQNY